MSTATRSPGAIFDSLVTVYLVLFSHFHVLTKSHNNNKFNGKRCTKEEKLSSLNDSFTGQEHVQDADGTLVHVHIVTVVGLSPHRFSVFVRKFLFHRKTKREDEKGIKR